MVPLYRFRSIIDSVKPHNRSSSKPQTSDTARNFYDSKAYNLKKIEIVGQLFDFAVATKSQFFRKKHPEATEPEIKKMALESIERGTR